MAKKTIQFNSFANGIGASEWENNAFHTIVGLDIYSKPGIVQCNRELINADTNENTVVDTLCTASCVVPAGDIFFSDNSGNIYKIHRTTEAVTKVHTNSQGAVVGIGYLNTYLYYATATKLGRILLANASDEASWSTFNNTWATFTVGGAYKHMVRQNLSLFITDGYLIASVDNTGAFSANVLDFEVTQVATALCKQKDYLLIGTTQGSNADKAGLFLWDCFSPSWSTSDEISERGVNCFIDGDEVTYISIGLIGNIYYWNGDSATFLFRLNDAGNVVATDVNPYGSANLNGLPLLNTVRGIYSIGRAKANMSLAQSISYVPSEGQGTTMGAISSVGSRIYSAWSTDEEAGIDKFGPNYAQGFVITPVALGKLSELKAKYAALPEGTSLSAQLDKDTAGFGSNITFTKDDTDERAYKSKEIGNKSMCQAKIFLNPFETSTPEVYDIEFL